MTTIFERFDEEFDGDTFEPEYWEHARDGVKSFLRDELNALAGDLSDRSEHPENLALLDSGCVRAIDMAEVNAAFKKYGINL